MEDIYCQEGYKEFRNNIVKSKEPRQHRVRNSGGTYDAYKYYRKNRPKEKKYVLTESQYFSIIRKVNEHLGDLLVTGNDVLLPHRLGRLEIRKYNSNITIDEKSNKIKTNLPIDWDKTLRLWFEDKECFKDKVLVRVEEKEIYKVYYNKVIAEYNNKSFYEFNVNRDLKKRLKQNIKRGKIDAFSI